MAEIKRPNYFTSQFLVEKDFNDEQAYHLNMRRRLNRVQSTFGVADGFAVTWVSTNQVQVGPGTAVDSNGREIALDDAQTYKLATVGNNLDVYLTISYQEALDPADHYTQAGLDKFTRTTERPLLQDGTAVPPADGSVILLARIRLSATGTIESNGSINSTVRVLAGAKLAHKVAEEAQPTAAQIDTRGGTNAIVTQINAGTGVIANSRLERVAVTGTVTFVNLALNQEQFSSEIDPGLGDGPLLVECALDDILQANVTLASDAGYSRAVLVRADINRTTGRFRLFAIRTQPATGPVIVRWYAFKLQRGADASIQVGVTVSPATVSMAGNSSQVLTATVTNATTTGVSWSGPEPGGGSLNSTTPTTTTYVSPALSGTYHVSAACLADPSKSATTVITVTAAIAVNLSQTTANLITGGQLTLTGNVINTSNIGITWTILNSAGGTLSATSGPSTTFTAPGAPGTYTVVATSAADTTKTASCVISVSAVTISVSADSNPIAATGSTVIRATITPSFVNQNANWTKAGAGSLSSTQGPTTTYFAPGVGATIAVTGTSVADPSKSQTVTVNVNNVTGGGGPGGPGGPGPGGKFAVISEDFAGGAVVSGDDQAPSAPAATADAKADPKARTFVRPQERPKPKNPPGKG